MPTLYDFLINENYIERSFFTLKDWQALGKGEIEDEKIIEAMLADGYENMKEVSD